MSFDHPPSPSSPKVSADIPKDLPACLLTLRSACGTCTLSMAPTPTTTVKGGKARTNIYRAVNPFKAEHAATEVSIMQLAAGGLLLGGGGSIDGTKRDC